MTRIDFYQITESNMSADVLACRLCQKAWDARQKVLLLTTDAEHSDRLSQMLWTLDEESFIPHDSDEEDGYVTPILVRHEADPRGERQLLINLSTEIPVYFAQFERVFELVTDENKNLARTRYSYYKERGYELKHHKL